MIRSLFLLHVFLAVNPFCFFFFFTLKWFFGLITCLLFLNSIAQCLDFLCVLCLFIRDSGVTTTPVSVCDCSLCPDRSLYCTFCYCIVFPLHLLALQLSPVLRVRGPPFFLSPLILVFLFHN